MLKIKNYISYKNVEKNIWDCIAYIYNFLLFNVASNMHFQTLRIKYFIGTDLSVLQWLKMSLKYEIISEIGI